MILTTTSTIEGLTIDEYKGVVFGEVISGVNFFKDFAADIDIDYEVLGQDNGMLMVTASGTAVKLA